MPRRGARNDRADNTCGIGCVSVVTVTSGHRVVIPKQLKQSVDWLRKSRKSINCTIEWLGNVRGLQLRPKSQEARAATFEGTTIDFDESHSRCRQVLRSQANKWAVRLERYIETFRFTVPEPVRRIGLLPGEKGRILLFGFQDIFELWEPDDWHQNLRQLCENGTANPAQIAGSQGGEP